MMSETELKKDAASAINPPFSPLSMPRSSKPCSQSEGWTLRSLIGSRVPSRLADGSLQNAAKRAEACKIEIPMPETSR